jgi:hypothetical protein
MFGFDFSPRYNDVPFETLCQATARTALATLRYAGHLATLRNLKLLLASAPRTKAEVRSSAHRHGSFCRACLEAATERVAVGEPRDMAAVKEARLLFLTILPTSDPGSRKCVETAVLALAPVFSASPVAEAVAS